MACHGATAAWPPLRPPRAPQINEPARPRPRSRQEKAAERKIRVHQMAPEGIETDTATAPLPPSSAPRRAPVEGAVLIPVARAHLAHDGVHVPELAVVAGGGGHVRVLVAHDVQHRREGRQFRRGRLAVRHGDEGAVDAAARHRAAERQHLRVNQRFEAGACSTAFPRRARRDVRQMRLVQAWAELTRWSPFARAGTTVLSRIRSRMPKCTTRRFGR
mmetsp:Transcript_2040/g.6075  ORF Transcript_2040/g.6075 Transcript_2040/m.6075 type:complete len:217 (+) Transcript_2040:20-670(+)